MREIPRQISQRWQLTLPGLALLITLYLGTNIAVGGTGGPGTDLPLDPISSALSTPPGDPPSPFLAASGLALEPPAPELELRGPAPSQRIRRADQPRSGSRSISTTAARIPTIQLQHDTFASHHLAARAGLLARGATSPPPPLQPFYRDLS